MADRHELSREFKKLYEGPLFDTLDVFMGSETDILRLDCSRIQNSHPQAAEQIYADPDTAVDAARARATDFLDDGIEIEAVRFINLPEDRHLRLNDLRKRHLGELVALEVEVADADPVVPWMEEAVFMCKVCGMDGMTWGQTYGEIKAPPQCLEADCGVSGKDLYLNKDRCHLRDFQTILIKSVDSVLDDAPVRPCYLLDDRAGMLGKGDQTTIVGEYQIASFDQQRESQLNTFVEAMTIEGRTGSGADQMSREDIADELSAAIDDLEGDFGVERDQLVDHVAEQHGLRETEVSDTLDELVDEGDLACPNGDVVWIPEA